MTGSKVTLADFSARTPAGTEQPLSAYAGDVVLVVNTASKCGFTPQFAGLEQLWEKHRDHGFVILGFPCNQFGHQDPGTDAEIGEFCQLNYGVSFPMYAKIDVNGRNAHPLYDWLKDSKRGVLSGAIKWNFTKFLIGRDGRVIARFAPTTTPADLEDAVAEAIAAPRPSVET